MNVLGSFQGWVDTPLNIFVKGVWSNISSSNYFTTYVTPGKSGGMSSTGSGSSSYIYVYNPNSGGASTVVIGRLEGMLNLTGYNYIYLNTWIADKTYNCGANARIGVSTNASLTNNAMAAYVDLPWNDGGGTKIINVSNLSGNYYFYLYLPAMRKTSDQSPELQVREIVLKVS